MYCGRRTIESRLLTERPAVFLGPAIAILVLVASGTAVAAAAAPLVRAGRIDTPVHPAAAVYLHKLLEDAARDGAALVVVGLSTPGGLLT